jgi:hypothetical protein
VEIFKRHFNIIALYQVDGNLRIKGIDEGFQYEGEELLSREIMNELKAFPRELLITRAYLIIACKR